MKNTRKQAIITNTLIPLLLISLALLISLSTVSANEIYVNTTGNDTTGTGTADNPYLTIQTGINNLDTDGTLRLANGQYNETGNTNITITKNMTIIGESQNDTIINGTGTNWVFNIQSGVNVTICNLTITDGYTTGFGGALYNEGSVTISGSTFTANTARWGGALWNGDLLTVTGCTFTDNHATNSGGAIFNEGSVTISGSTFTANTAEWGGALWNGDLLTVTGSIFTDNTADYGGAFRNYDGTANVNFNRFYNNAGDVINCSLGSVNAENNWWGTNNPNADWSQFLFGVTSPTKWVVLTINVIPDVLCVGETSTVTANLNYNNMGEDLMATYEKSIPTVEVLFDVDGLGTLSTYSGIIYNGNNATTTFTAGQMPGSSTVNATVDNVTVEKSITIQREDVYVANTGSDSNNGTADSPFLTLSKAIESVRTGGRIHVANGEYTGSQNRGLTITKNMTILQDNWISGTGSSVIINAENKDCIFYNEYTFVLQNLILINGNNTKTFSYGGAIQNAGNLTVENCTFLNNTAEYGGAIANVFYGGIRIMYSGTSTVVQEYSCAITSTIIGCTFANNTATYDGGAISNYICTICTAEAYDGANLTLGLYTSILSTISNCTFTNNTAVNEGGAISNRCRVNGTAISEDGNATALSSGYINNTITGCTLTNNTATRGGAISEYCDMNLYASATNTNTNAIVNGNCTINEFIMGNTLANNTATYGGGISAAYSYGITVVRILGGFATTNPNLNLTSEVHFNRIVGNTASLGSAIFGFYSSTANATYNWWGSNGNPSGQIVGLVDYSPWLFMTINATPATINNTQTSNITVSFNNYSSDASTFSPLDPDLGHMPDGVPVTFSLIGDILGSLNEPLTVTTTNGTASILFTASNVGIQQINATTDKQNVSVDVTINPASYVEITEEFRNLPWGEVITTAYYNDKIYVIVKVHNLGPDSTSSVDVSDLLDGLTWAGNYYVYRTVGSYPNTESAWVLNDPEHPFNGTNWDVGSLSTLIGSERWLAIEVMVNQTGTVSSYAETVNQSSYAYHGYDNYTAYLTVDITPTNITVDNVSGNKGGTVTLKAVLTDYLGNALKGKTVEFCINNVKVGENTTDSTGTALFNYDITQIGGKYNISALFTGDTLYVASVGNGTLKVNQSGVYLNVTVSKTNPTVGETITITFKLGNNGPDPADNVVLTYVIPEGMQFVSIETEPGYPKAVYNATTRTITWNLGTVPILDPWIKLKVLVLDSGLFNVIPTVTTSTYDPNLKNNIQQITINAATKTNTSASTNETVGMQNTGIPLNYLILAIFMVVSGLLLPKRK